MGGSLVQNGGFELPALATADCMGGHDSTFNGDDHCQYKYLYPPIRAFCHADCQVRDDTENDGFRTENDGFLTKNDGFLTKNDGFHTASSTRGRSGSAIRHQHLEPTSP